MMPRGRPGGPSPPMAIRAQKGTRCAPWRLPRYRIGLFGNKTQGNDRRRPEGAGLVHQRLHQRREFRVETVTREHAR